MTVLLGLVAGCPDGEMRTADAGSRGVDAAGACRTALDCDDGVFCNGVERCALADPAADERGCLVPAAARCLPTQTCDEDADQCLSDCDREPDADGDGADSMACGGTDCDDSNSRRAPGSPEFCDAASEDEDCDPSTFGVRDLDGDAYPDATCCNTDDAGATRCGTDCDDTRPDVHPALAETCDGADNDCDSAVDEGVRRTFYVDADGDSFGDELEPTTMACTPPAGHTEMGRDCDDTRADVSPGSPESCDLIGTDENCDGTPNPASMCACVGDGSRGCGLLGRCAAGTQRCVGGSWGACSIAPVLESCNEEDDDCDGMTDEMLTVTCFVDADNDGFSPTGSVMLSSCPHPAREAVGGCPTFQTDVAPVAPLLDCDDASSASRPGGSETCNGRDDDCDGATDEGVTLVFRPDADNDGYGDPAGVPTVGCTAAAGYVANGTDCDDTSASRRPGILDICDGLDNDCNGQLDGPGEDDDRDLHADSSCAGPLGTDCDDTNPIIHRDAPEICDRRDDDCSAGGGAAIDEDFDNDGYAPIAASCTGGSLPRTDCDDRVASAYPMASEICDGLDSDCDGTRDENPESTASCATLRSGIANTTWTCASGSCGVASCSTPYADCDSAASTGCEANTDTSTLHCGRCSNVCRSGIACRAGICDEIVGVASGSFTNCAVRESGLVLCWGRGDEGQLGNGGTADSSRPVAVIGLSDATQVTVGFGHACARRRSGAVSCWGDNGDGQLGNGTTTRSATPVAVAGLTDAVMISAGDSTTCAVRATGAVVCWGENTFGQLGDGTTIPSPIPVTVARITGAVDVSAGGWSTCAVGASSSVWCWGRNNAGQLGDATYTDSALPIASGSAFDVESTGTHVVSNLGGGVRSWGLNADNQLGHSPSDYDVPVARFVDDFVTSDVSDVAAGGNFSCVMRQSGTVACFGSQEYGQLGNAVSGFFTFGTVTPQTVLGLYDAVAISSGGYHSCALRATRDVVCWGDNSEGQLGDGTLTMRSVPVAVVGLR